MLKRNLQTLIWKYDKFFTSIVALIPISLQPTSAKLGHMTLPSIWASTILITSLLLYSFGSQKLAALGIAIIVCIPIGTVLKLLVRRARPKTIYAQNMKVKSYSFPSSHTYSATLGGGFFAVISLAYFIGLIGLFLAMLWTLFAVIIGISRIHVGAHYPTDVTAGWLLGALVLAAIAHIML